MPFSDEFHTAADQLVARYPVARSALLPLLHLVQSEHGYVSEEGIAFVAQRLHLTKAEVGAVATFYTMFKRAPVGDYLLSVCTNPTCQVAGSQTIYERYKAALGGRLTDPDTKVSIEEAECLGICDAAPVVQVNYEMYGPLTDEEADRLLDGCRKGQPPTSNWSGEPAPTFAEVERELSGANDAFGAKLVEAARHSVTGYDVPPMYKSGETDIPVTAPGGDPAGHGGDVFQAAFGAVPPAAVEVTAVDEEASSLQVGEAHHPDAEQHVDTTGATEPGATDSTREGGPSDQPVRKDEPLPASGDEPTPGASADDGEEA